MKASSALKSWLDHPSARTRSTFKRALDRALNSSKHVAGVAVGRRRLEIRRSTDGTWTVVNKDGEHVFFAKKTRTAKPTSRLRETVAQHKRRMMRERDRDQRKAAAKARREKRAALVKKGRQTRADRGRVLAAARTKCRTEIAAARTTPRQPARRVAVARARARCAVRASGIEKAFAAQLSATMHDLAELRGQQPARARRYAPKRTGTAKVAREERDSAMIGELERRGLGKLVPLWHKFKHLPRIKGLPFDRAIEQFAEAIQESEDEIREQRHHKDADAAVQACAQAQHEARAGNSAAKLWADEHCHDDGRPKRRLSAQARTLSMFGSIAPPAELAASSKQRRGGERKRARLRRSQHGEQPVVPF